MFKKLTAILCALAMICFALPGCAETAGRPEPGVTEGGWPDMPYGFEGSDGGPSVPQDGGESTPNP